MTELREREAHRCKLRRLAATWLRQLEHEYGATLIEWVDTGVGTEKQVAVMRMALGEQPLIVVAWRGSKTLADWLRTDLSMRFLRVCAKPPKHSAEAGAAGGAASAMLLEPEVEGIRGKFMPRRARATQPCVAKGMWRAYAGRVGRTAAGASPRARVAASVARAVAAEPSAIVVLTGHSMGGTLATLCACDLLGTMPGAPLAAPCVCLTFGASRSFNHSFRASAGALQRAGRLVAVRVVAAGDFVPRLPFGVPLGCVHAVAPRLLLAPRRARAPLAFDAAAPADDRDTRWAVDPVAHTLHSSFLAAELPPGRKRTVPQDCAWPLEDWHQSLIGRGAAGTAQEVPCRETCMPAESRL